MSNTAISDGGSAFPHEGIVRDVSRREAEDGMTLRDYFASQALVGLLSADSGVPSFELVVQSSYDLADEMLRMREGSAGKEAP